MTDNPTRDSRGFRIGAVARLTGISPDALRVWERRYQVISPERSASGTRLYSEQDVERLRLIKRLVDAGQAIGTVGTLELRQLRARITHLEGTEGAAAPSQPVRLLLAGPTLAQRLAAAAGAEDPARLRLVGTLDGLAALEHVDVQTDVLMVECATLDEQSAQQLRRVRRLSGARLLLVVYGFAPREALAAVEAEGAIVLRFPVNWEAIRHYCIPEPAVAPPRLRTPQPGTTAPITEPPPARRFDDAQLARAAMIDTAVRCECPHHLADLIIALGRFERYSAECESRNDRDAALHAYLHHTTAQARSVMEGALAHLLETEGLDVDPPA